MLRTRPLARPVLLALSLVVGLGAALGLAWFMHLLIHSTDMRLVDSDRTQMLDFVRIKRDEVVQRKERKLERPKVNEIPEAPPMDQSANAGAQLAVNLAPLAISTDLDLGGGMGAGDGEYLPIIKVAPIYPRAALAKGVSGDCLVRYTVTTTGAVRDVEVVKEQCPVASFRKPSVEAAKRFKYKPRIVDGVPIEVHGISNLFHFQWEWHDEIDREKL